MLAEYTAFKVPNPPPQRDETAKYGGRDLITRIASVAAYFMTAPAWIVHSYEIAALLAQNLAPTSTASTALSALRLKPARADRIGGSPAFAVGLSILLLAAAVRQACYITLGRHFTVQLALLKSHKLVTSGPYSIVRHPSYTALVGAIGAMLVVLLAPGGWLVESGVLETFAGKAAGGVWTVWLGAVVVCAIGRTTKEDAVLRREFGAQWAEWAKRTPYVLVPYVY
ncbi:hypothetical protein BD413DRAFT_476415 [Trametes elegans]|nr:hypothetical protein BD413DRAFT_476415 [Trametes elegans]